MGKVVCGMTISLDGFVNDRNGDMSRLYPDVAGLRDTEVIQESIRATGAVILGRGSYDLAQGDLTDYEYQTPIFVLTHHPPEQGPKGQNENLKVYFVTEGVERAVEHARAAAGDREVTVIGPDVIRQVLRAGLCDELDMDIAPVLLCEGTRLFEQLGSEPIELEPLKMLEYRGVTHLRYRVVKGAA